MMTKGNVSDELIAMARAAWLALDGSSLECWRAAIEAVAPRLRAEGMREAAGLVDRAYDADRILARADALEKEGGVMPIIDDDGTPIKRVKISGPAVDALNNRKEDTPVGNDEVSPIPAEAGVEALGRILFEWGIITDTTGLVRNLAAAGFKIMPREPTEAMAGAVKDGMTFADAYRAMWDYAP